MCVYLCTYIYIYTIVHKESTKTSWKLPKVSCRTLGTWPVQVRCNSPNMTSRPGQFTCPYQYFNPKFWTRKQPLKMCPDFHIHTHTHTHPVSHTENSSDLCPYVKKHSRLRGLRAVHECAPTTEFKMHSHIFSPSRN